MLKYRDELEVKANESTSSHVERVVANAVIATSVLARRTAVGFSNFFSDFLAVHEDQSKALLREQEELSVKNPNWDRRGRIAAAISSFRSGDSFEFVAASFGKDVAIEAQAAYFSSNKATK